MVFLIKRCVQRLNWWLFMYLSIMHTFTPTHNPVLMHTTRRFVTFYTYYTASKSRAGAEMMSDWCFSYTQHLRRPVVRYHTARSTRLDQNDEVRWEKAGLCVINMLQKLRCRGANRLTAAVRTRDAIRHYFVGEDVIKTTCSGSSIRWRSNCRKYVADKHAFIVCHVCRPRCITIAAFSNNNSSSSSRSPHPARQRRRAALSFCLSISHRLAAFHRLTNRQRWLQRPVNVILRRENTMFEMWPDCRVYCSLLRSHQPSFIHARRCRVINVWNSLPDSVSFKSLRTP